MRRSGIERLRMMLATAGILLCGAAMAQKPVPPIRLVDMHTAGVVQKGDYLFEGRLYENEGSGILLGIAAGVTDRFCFGLGYGAEGLVGRSRDVHYNPYPGCVIKFRLVEETYTLPGVAIGFDYQGFGGIADERRFGYRGYLYKSQGFFVALSKSYLFARFLEIGLHGDVNLSLEQIDEVAWPNAGVGIDIGLSNKFSCVAEYDLGLHTRDPYGSSDAYALPFEGYCNIGLRIHFTPEFSLEFDARDLFEHRTYLDTRGVAPRERSVGWSREIKITYCAPIRG